MVAIRDRARAVERAIYAIGSRLVPPPLDALPDAAVAPYQPFAAIEAIEIPWDGVVARLKPLVVFDDVHALHPEQFVSFFRELARREVRIGRWLMMRLDALAPDAVFRSADEDTLPGLKAGRDFADIFMQSDGTRLAERRRFEKMAADMAGRYVALVQPLRERQHREFRPLLPTSPPRLSAPDMARLRALIDRDQKALDVGAARRETIERLPVEYAEGAKSQDVGEDVRLAMTRVLLHRYSKRLPNRELALFGHPDPDPARPLKADAGVAEAARIFLFHSFRRPYQYGFDLLCQASNENAELFLQLAGALVERMVTRATRGQDPALSPAQQQQALKEKAEEIIRAWSFPFARKVQRLVRHIADACREETLKPNAPLGSGANAFAIPDADMRRLLGSHDELAFVLKFAIAYGALVAVWPYGQGGEEWCLLELSGPACLMHGLTLNRGGFLKRRASDLADAIQEGV